jgi:hypothetical protein
MAKQISVKPIRKVTAGAAGGAAITVAIWMIKAVWKIEVPSEVAAAMTVLMTFLVSYQIPAAEDDLVHAEVEVRQAA